MGVLTKCIELLTRVASFGTSFRAEPEPGHAKFKLCSVSLIIILYIIFSLNINKEVMVESLKKTKSRRFEI